MKVTVISTPRLLATRIWTRNYKSLPDVALSQSVDCVALHDDVLSHYYFNKVKINGSLILSARLDTYLLGGGELIF